MIRTKQAEKKVSLFLDSGAFSAFTKGIEIKIEDYIQFIKDNTKYIDIYANLDVIGDAEATWQNQKIMEAAGLSPIPCFHAGEEWRYLERYIANYDYIALGGIAQLGRRAQSWMDSCFDLLCDKEGYPKVKVHGFAVTSLRLMLRYPFFSVDSTSWVLTGRMGSIFVPRERSGQWIYDDDSLKVAISARSPAIEIQGNRHFSNMSKKEKETVLRYIHSCGFDIGESKMDQRHKDSVLADNEKWISKSDDNGMREVEIVITPGLCNDYRMRDKINIMYFLELEKQIPPWPTKFIRKGLRSLI